MRGILRRARRAIDCAPARGEKRDHLTRQLGRRRGKINDRVFDDNADPRRPVMGEGCDFHFSTSRSGSFRQIISNY
jgi:hypothetical protein